MIQMLALVVCLYALVRYIEIASNTPKKGLAALCVVAIALTLVALLGILLSGSPSL